MATIPEMLRRFQSINLDEQLPIIIQNTRGEMVRLNKMQLTLGKKSDNEFVTPGYSFATYAIQKEKQNPLAPFGVPDLRLTGDFYKGFYANVQGGQSVIFGSTDSKSDNLEAKYGKEIFGLNIDSKTEYTDETVMPEVRKYITGLTGLKFT